MLKQKLKAFLRCLWWAGVALLLCMGQSSLAARTNTAETPLKEVRIGVLALRGADHATKAWQPTADLLHQKLNGYHFSIVPLSFGEVAPAVANAGIDFLIANSAIHVMMAETYGVSPVATIFNRLDHYDSSLFGGVIFRRTGREGTPTLPWIKGKRFAAVDATSFGGFLTALRELKRAGINPYEDCASLDFSGTHDAVVLAVLNDKADAGTVRTDVLERMAAEGKIDLAQIEVIAPIKNGTNKNFPYLRSTRLYPEWPISKLAHVQDSLSRDIVHVLFDITPESNPARSAGIAGWNTTANYQPVEALLRELELPPYEHQPATLNSFIEDQPLASLLIVGGFLVTSGMVFMLWGINRRLHCATASLQESNRMLEQRVQERTAALESSKLILQDMATHDPLTGLFNRRALEERVLHEVNRVNRYGEPLSVLMIDIDYFKKVNDSFGHAAGDIVLTAIARTLQETVRNTDTVARYGGEEFVVLLPMTHLKDAQALAERLCHRVGESDINLGDGQLIRVTVSIGVSAASASGNTSWDALIDAADAAMYAAKQSGRNRVSVA